MLGRGGVEKYTPSYFMLQKLARDKLQCDGPLGIIALHKGVACCYFLALTPLAITTVYGCTIKTED